MTQIDVNVYELDGQLKVAEYHNGDTQTPVHSSDIGSDAAPHLATALGVSGWHGLDTWLSLEEWLLVSSKAVDSYLSNRK